MDFRLTEEQHTLITRIREFLSRECPPDLIHEHEKADEPPMAVREKLKEIGVFGFTVPEEYGGSGPRLQEAAIVVEELSRVWPALAWLYIGTAFYGGENVNNLGSPEQKRALLPGLASGDVLFAYALTEPETGSDAASARVSAKQEGDEFYINGTKTLISLPNKADFIITLTRTNPEVHRHEGLTMFVVPRESEGLTFTKIKKLGYKSATLCELFYDNVRVGPEDILGGSEMLNRGWSQLLSTLEVEHLEIAACGVGVAQGALDQALRYSTETEYRGKPLSRSQAIMQLIAEMGTEVHASRLLLYHSCWLVEQGKPAFVESSMAKYYATETAKKCSTMAMQMAGDFDSTVDFNMQRFLRDSLILTIGGGTSEILKNMIGSQIVKRSISK